MKRLWLLPMAVLLAACSKKEPPPEPVRPVLSVTVEALSEESLGRFAGSIQARYESNTGFRVGGRIASRNVDVGAEVEKGTLLATLDPSDQQNQLRSAQGDLAKIQAQLINAQANARRQQALFDRGVGAQAQLDVANTDLKTTQASLDQARAAVNQSKDQLGYTELRAPVDGVIGNRRARVGAYAQAGSQQLSVVPASGLWVDANFKEDQLARMKPGQRVSIRADVLSGQEFHGRLDSLAPATGSQFSVLPPENATGNFTKIVQRVPVRILLDPADGVLGHLRPGLSVTAEVDTRAQPETSAVAVAP